MVLYIIYIYYGIMVILYYGKNTYFSLNVSHIDGCISPQKIM